MEKRYCSFCEKERADVPSMIIGAFGQICGECVGKFYKELTIPPESNPPDAADGGNK